MHDLRYGHDPLFGKGYPPLRTTKLVRCNQLNIHSYVAVSSINLVKGFHSSESQLQGNSLARPFGRGASPVEVLAK